MSRCRCRSKTISAYLFMIFKSITKYASHLDPWKMMSSNVAKMMSSNVAKWCHYIATPVVTYEPAPRTMYTWKFLQTSSLIWTLYNSIHYHCCSIEMLSGLTSGCIACFFDIYQRRSHFIDCIVYILITSCEKFRGGQNSMVSLYLYSLNKKLHTWG